MKKTLKIRNLTCVILLVCTFFFSACNQQTPNKPSHETTAHTHSFGEWLTIADPTCAKKGEQERVCSCGERETREKDALVHLYENGLCALCGDPKTAYELFFVSNGDGTCYVSEIRTYPTCDKKIVLEIPEVSPDGDRVTEVRCAPFSYPIPLILLPQDYAEIEQALRAQVDSGEFDIFYFNKFGSYFISSAELEEKDKAKFLSKYPIAQIGDVYVFDTSAFDSEEKWVLYYLYGYADYTAAELAEDYRNLYAFVNASDTANKAEIRATLPSGPSHGLWIHEIVLPNSITSIEQGAFYSCENLKRVYYAGSESDWDKIAIDLTDGKNDDLVSAVRYYYSETQPATAGRYWHYVDGVPTPW